MAGHWRPSESGGELTNANQYSKLNKQ